MDLLVLKSVATDALQAATKGGPARVPPRVCVTGYGKDTVAIFAFIASNCAISVKLLALFLNARLLRLEARRELHKQLPRAPFEARAVQRKRRVRISAVGGAGHE